VLSAATLDFPVVLVDFSDLPFTASEADLVDAHDGVSAFYDAATGGQLDLGLQIRASFQADDPVASYGERLAPDTGLRAIAAEAAAALAAQTSVDFGAYDSDGNGTVDGFVVHHAGWGAETEGATSDMLWSAKTALSTPVTTWDGYTLSVFGVFPEYEYDADPATSVGVISHELGHVLGLPDLYDVDYDGDGRGSGLGYWSVMASGSWYDDGRSPVGFDAWSSATMGWRPIEAVCGTQTYTLSSSRSAPVYLLWPDEGVSLSDEYVLVDLRTQAGVDAGVPGSADGVQMIHHDPAGGTWSNTSDDGSPYRVWVVEADASGDTSFDGDLYAGTDTGDDDDLFGSGDSFTNSTSPAPATGAGEPVDIAVTDVEERGGAWTVTLQGYSCDGDGDGYLDDDCDDGDASVHPGATETCDGRDQDCDGSVDEGAADPAAWHPDLDGDGFGDPDTTTAACEAPAGWIADASDCDDTDASLTPNTVWYADGDGDGYGDPAATLTQCDPPTGYLRDASDCDDADATVNPETWWYADADADGYGDPAAATQQCEAPTGSVRDGNDCDDTLAAVHPGADDVCNDRDDDCDGRVDPGFDLDGDAFSRCGGDCDDGDPATHPGATELCNDHDDDCDLIADEDFDADGDGWSICAALPDCDDGDAAVHPGAAEQCDGLDGACRGALLDVEADADGDGWRACDGDCDDADPSAWPGAPEAPNGRDDDCDGAVDEHTTAYDDDGDGFSEELGDCDDDDPAVFPGAGDAFDVDCDGVPDDDDADGDGWTASGGDCDDTDPLVVACPQPAPIDQSAGCDSAAGAPGSALALGALLLALRRRRACAAVVLAGCGAEVGVSGVSSPGVTVEPARLDLPTSPPGACAALPTLTLDGPADLVGADWWPSSGDPGAVTVPEVFGPLPISLVPTFCAGDTPTAGYLVFSFSTGDTRWIEATQTTMEAP
jgi:M6 family metalloprotease-like protein